MNIFGIDLIEILIRVPVVLICLVVHEVAHGYMAMKLGDPTARNLGRLTLNPLKHLDPIGAICMLFFRFGWAKPVPINSRYFRKPRRDMALTALAGPVSNFIMAFFGVFITSVSIAIWYRNPVIEGFGYNLWTAWLIFIETFILMNISLGVFNMIPVPPLDGSRIFLTFLPARYYFGIMKYERYIMLGMLVLLYTGLLTGPLSTIVTFIFNGMFDIVGLIPGLGF
ncbi:MAG: site-2 protease family protein [Clostridia bacterium]|nr:site-2 protease family protein [Clostridia bacterium]